MPLSQRYRKLIFSILCFALKMLQMQSSFFFLIKISKALLNKALLFLIKLNKTTEQSKTK